MQNTSPCHIGVGVCSRLSADKMDSPDGIGFTEKAKEKKKKKKKNAAFGAMSTFY